MVLVSDSEKLVHQHDDKTDTETVSLTGSSTAIAATSYSSTSSRSIASFFDAVTPGEKVRSTILLQPYDS